MKRVKFLAGLLIMVSVFVASCEQIENLLTFNISDETEITVPSVAQVNLPIELPTPDITTNSETEFEQNNTKADLVKNIYLKELKLSITDPADKTFSFLKEIHIYISTNDSDEIELAWSTDIPTDVQSINLTTTDNTLDTYVKASSYKLRTEVVTRETLLEDVTIKVNLTFQVTADPF